MVSTPRPFDRPLLIAVLDDHDECRTVTCRLLERRGFTTCKFESVAAFIDSREKHRIDCLLLDVRMPGLDGIALHDCLQKTNFKFPVIFCTGQETDARLEEALAKGAFAVLKKPLAADALVDTICAACGVDAVARKRAGSA